MIQINNENEQQHFTSSPEFRLSRYKLNEIPCQFLETKYDFQISKQHAFWGQ